jgi:hypothetical protein
MFRRSMLFPSSGLKCLAGTVRDHIYIHKVQGGKSKGKGPIGTSKAKTEPDKWGGSKYPSSTLLSSDAYLEPPHWSSSVSASLVPIWPLSLRLPLLQPYIYGPLQSWLITPALKMKMAHFSKTLASTNQSTQQFNPKEHNQKSPTPLIMTRKHWTRVLPNCTFCRLTQNQLLSLPPEVDSTAWQEVKNIIYVWPHMDKKNTVEKVVHKQSANYIIYTWIIESLLW